MPVQKTHKGAKKRFKVTGTGKLKRTRAGKKHLNGPKTAKRKRQLRKPMTRLEALEKTYVRLLGED